MNSFNPLETSFPRSRKHTSDTLVTQPRGNDRTDPHGIRQVSDYRMPNVSDKVLRIIHSYTDYVNRVVWKKY
jgi:UDP-N-acetyl-L-fucosamine synthase